MQFCFFPFFVTESLVRETGISLPSLLLFFFQSDLSPVLFLSIRIESVCSIRGEEREGKKKNKIMALKWN